MDRRRFLPLLSSDAILALAGQSKRATLTCTFFIDMESEFIEAAVKPSKHTVYGLSEHFDADAGYGILHQSTTPLSVISPTTAW